MGILTNRCSLLLCIAVITACSLYGQTTTDFEAFNIENESFLNGSDGSSGFIDGHIRLPNQYDQMFDFWEGWALSNITDNTTPGFNNQYSCIAGEGYGQSANYAVGYAYDPVVINLTDEAIGGAVNSMWVSNSTFAYYAMKDGDAFSKKFGGITGDDPDFFLLTFKGFKNGELKQDSVAFFLADFRFDNNELDYILDHWQYVDLTDLGQVDSLQLSLTSSDTGVFGLNTPAYFCVDQIETADNTTFSLDIPERQQVDCRFDSSTGHLEMKGDSEFTFEVVDIAGKVIKRQSKFSKYHTTQIIDQLSTVLFVRISFENRSQSVLKLMMY